ncbi:MAG TPA: shikimate dehydrogenase [Hyphomicrobiales bacterium]|nr:shikimate dehydrogenase [Hyphomicrobiales bacterium]
MKRACVVGWPIKHSRSPLIHNYWLKQYGIEGSYTKEAVEPDRIESFLRNLSANGFVGCNVSLPHKETAYRVAARRDKMADIVKAANTLWYENGVLCASNTDIYGFLHSLDDQSPGWDRIGLPAAVLGAGGAARGIIKGLFDRGFRSIRIANRTRERAETLAGEFGAKVSVFTWEDRAEMLMDCGLLVNTTNLGMNGSEPLEIDLSGFSIPGVVCDIVYSPLETDLLRRARGAGFHIADGLGMLLHQAVPGFEKWFGVRPEVSHELRALIAADLESEG